MDTWDGATPEQLVATASRVGRALARLVAGKPCTRCDEPIAGAGVYLLSVEASGAVQHGFWCRDCLRRSDLVREE